MNTSNGAIWLIVGAIAIIVLGLLFFGRMRSKPVVPRVPHPVQPFDQHEAARTAEAPPPVAAPQPVYSKLPMPVRRPIKSGDRVKLVDTAGLSTATQKKLSGTYQAKVTRGSHGKKQVQLLDLVSKKPVDNRKYPLRRFRVA